MRIRKNKKLIYTPENVHVCRLNQSTWDVIPLSPEQYPSYLHHQFEWEYSCDENGSIGDSIGVVESVATMVGSEEEAIMKVGGMVIDGNDDNNETKAANQFGFECQCEEEEGDEESSQEPALLKSCNNSNGNGYNINLGKKVENYNNQPTGSRRGRARASRKDSFSTPNPYEFYYYSGFGPSWVKKRRDGDEGKGINKNQIEPKEVENNICVITSQNNSALLSSSQIDDNEEYDYVDEEEEDDENGDSGKKRMRKPIKARSLKSLM
ncbi:uncharacterized protein LOC120153447 [Hibiscus syriacus]|nr:uncharacterized protein LOC120153447 [Hibiscus syriacus]